MAEHFHKTARKHGLNFNLISYDLSQYAHIVGLAKIIAGKKFSEWNLTDLDWLAAYTEANLVVPFMDEALPLLAQHKHFSPFVPAKEVIDRFYDKKLMHEWAKENDILIPDQPGYPYYIKPRRGWGSRDNHIIRSIKDWPITFSFDKYIVEHYLEFAEEISVDCYVTKDKQYFAYPRQRLLVSRGEVENSVTIRDLEVQNLALQVMVLGNITGPANIQFLKRDGNYYLIDVNTRFGGGVPLTIHAGADYVDLMFCEMLGLPFPKFNWKPNVLMIRAAREIFFENYSNPA